MIATSRYHMTYRTGQPLRLVTFYIEREGSQPDYLTLKDVIDLGNRDAWRIYPVRIDTLVVIIEEAVRHGAYEIGYTATGTHPKTHRLAVAHHQYPTYQRVRDEKARWRVYLLNLAHQGTWQCTVWEDHAWVMKHLDKIRYGRLRKRLQALTSP